MIPTCNTIGAEAFIAERPELRNDKKTTLRYLESISDKFWIEVNPKGNSIAVCDFDCGAYKGSEVLRFNLKTLNPLLVALSLIRLTSGHHFSFDEAEAAVVATMMRRLEARKK